MKKIVTVALLMASLFSQENQIKYEKAKIGIGGVFSYVTGSGIGYRVYDKESYIQYSGLATMSSYDIYMNVGISKGAYLYTRYTGSDELNATFAIKYHYGVSIYDVYSNNNDSAAGGYLGAGLGIEYGNPKIKGYTFEFMLDYVLSGKYDNRVMTTTLDMRPTFAMMFNF